MHVVTFMLHPRHVERCMYITVKLSLTLISKGEGTMAEKSRLHRKQRKINKKVEWELLWGCDTLHVPNCPWNSDSNYLRCYGFTASSDIRLTWYVVFTRVILHK